MSRDLTDDKPTKLIMRDFGMLPELLFFREPLSAQPWSEKQLLVITEMYR